MKNLTKIIEKYSKLEYNSNNYNVGGGLSESGKKASNRHEDALNDSGKLTLGKAAQIFKKATNVDIELINEVIKYAVPNMEWHHAGFLPKQFGGGMKRTYFLNANEIVNIAMNFNDIVSKLEIEKSIKRNEIEIEKSKAQIELDFLKENATKVFRVRVKPQYFYETDK